MKIIPLQDRIHVDESLNDTRVFLSHFDSKTVNNVLDELHNSRVHIRQKNP